MKARNIVELLCIEVVDLITEYLSRAMGPEDRARLEQHFLVCAPCAVHLAQVKTTLKLARGLGHAPDGGEVDNGLLALYRSWNRK